MKLVIILDDYRFIQDFEIIKYLSIIDYVNSWVLQIILSITRISISWQIFFFNNFIITHFQMIIILLLQISIINDWINIILLIAKSSSANWACVLVCGFIPTFKALFMKQMLTERKFLNYLCWTHIKVFQANGTSIVIK